MTGRPKPPHRWTYGWWQVLAGDGVWAVFDGGRFDHCHNWRIGAWWCVRKKNRSGAVQ